MNHYRSICRIVLTCTLIIAASASASRSEPWDPLGIQNHTDYKPFGQYGPKVTISTISPTKVMNGGSLGQANRTASHYRTVAQNHAASQIRTGSQQHRVAQRVAPPRTARFEDLNLTVNMPSGPWTKLDPKKTGSHACYLISRHDPTIVISLAGELKGIESDDTNSSLLAKSQDKMKSLPGGAIEPGEQELSAGLIPGVAYHATVGEGESATYYAIWVAAYHGYNYKLAVYGNQKDKPAIDAAMRNFVSGIKLIQSNRVALTDGNKDTVTR